MNKFVDRIDEVLKRKSLKRSALCSDLELSPTSITDWARRGTIPSGDVCVKIAKYLNVNIQWLITGISENGLNEEERELLKKWTVLTNDQKQPILILINNYYEKQKG